METVIKYGCACVRVKETVAQQELFRDTAVMERDEKESGGERKEIRRTEREK